MAVAAFFFSSSNSIQGQEIRLAKLPTRREITPRYSLAVTGKQQGNETCTKKEGTINLMGFYCKFSAFQCYQLSLGDSHQWNSFQTL